MRANRSFMWAVLLGLLISTGEGATNAQTFAAKGVVKELKPDGKTIVIQHEAIAHYMDAMTMPFKVIEAKELAGLQPNDQITFQLHVTETESWIDQVTKTGTVLPGQEPTTPIEARPRHPLLDAKFTNELGQAVTLAGFQGQALAITFFFTRCPIPEYCPRLSKNFQAAARKLSSTPGAPTNWHFLSVTFDPEHDSPKVLKAYGELYQYDPAHWSFLTGSSNQISQLARESDEQFERDGAFFNHNFRTLIIDATGRLQMTFPIGGDLSDHIVEEIRQAVAPATNAEPKTLKTGK